MNALKQKIRGLTTEQLKSIALELVENPQSHDDMVFDEVLWEIDNRISEEECVKFYAELEEV